MRLHTDANWRAILLTALENSISVSELAATLRCQRITIRSAEKRTGVRLKRAHVKLTATEWTSILNTAKAADETVPCVAKRLGVATSCVRSAERRHRIKLRRKHKQWDTAEKASAMPNLDRLRILSSALHGERWQNAIARDLGVNPRQVHRWVSGQYEPHEGHIAALVEIAKKRSIQITEAIKCCTVT